ncbi:nucleotidyltransferase domain-containing protein [Atrimonas thermophila]
MLPGGAMRRGDIAKKIKRVIERTLEESGVGVDEVILFGSRARGDHEELSDYDLLVVLKGDFDIRKKREMRRKIYNELHSVFPATSFDVIVKTDGEFEEEKKVVNTISNQAFLEGRRI